MPYEKQNFKDGQVLTAEMLNHMEEGIVNAGGSGGGGIHVVDVIANDDGMMCSKTASELAELSQSAPVYLVFQGQYLLGIPTEAGDGTPIFTATSLNVFETNMLAGTIVVNEDKSVVVTTVLFTGTEF